MTLPDERAYAVTNTQEFLRDLLDSKKTPGVPKAIRVRARSCLRHYPNSFDIKRAADKCPDIFQVKETAHDGFQVKETVQGNSR